MPPTAVAFDFGGVLTHPPFAGLERYALELGLPADGLARYFRGDPQVALLETGQLTARDFFKYVCTSAEAAHGTRIDIRALGAAAAEGERLRPEVLELVAEVRARAKTALLTNNVREAGWRETFPHHLFDVVVDSSAVGARKPDPAIYRSLLAALGAAGADVAFVDDFEENLPPAQALGITTIHFTDLDDCRRALVRLGALEDPT